MKDFDHRYPGLKDAPAPPDEVDKTIELVCTACGEVTRVNVKRTMKFYDNKYPARRVVIECKCGQEQFILETRPLGSSKARA